MTLLAIIFLLALTFFNALALRNMAFFAQAHDYAPLQLAAGRAKQYEWDAFVWREIGAVVLTVGLFGTIGSVKSRRLRREAHQSFTAWTANRRR